MEEKRKLSPAIPILAVVVVLLALLCGKLWMDKNKVEKLANEAESLADEYKASYEEYKSAYEECKNSYDSLLEEKQKAEEEKKKAEEIAEAYQTKYNILVYAMLNDAATAEDIGNLTKNVWYNAIYEIKDIETDKYTKENGVFVSDFNDALQKLVDDEEYSEKVYTLYKNQLDVQTLMKEMVNPPAGFENAFKALEDYYYSYLDFTDLVIKIDGSLKSFSEKFSAADEELAKKYVTVSLYVK